MSRKSLRMSDRERKSPQEEESWGAELSSPVQWSTRRDDLAAGRKLRFSDLAPFLSLAMITCGLFSMALAKMEVRRLGYAIVQLSKEERRWRDEERSANLTLAKALGPERLEAMAGRRLTLRRPQQGEIIQMTENGVALEQ